MVGYLVYMVGSVYGLAMAGGAVEVNKLLPIWVWIPCSFSPRKGTEPQEGSFGSVSFGWRYQMHAISQIEWNSSLTVFYPTVNIFKQTYVTVSKTNTAKNSWSLENVELCLFSKYPGLCKHGEGFHQEPEPRENKRLSPHILCGHLRVVLIVYGKGLEDCFWWTLLF